MLLIFQRMNFNDFSSVKLNNQNYTHTVRDNQIMLNLKTGEQIPLCYENMIEEFTKDCSEKAIDCCKTIYPFLNDKNLYAKTDSRPKVYLMD